MISRRLFLGSIPSALAAQNGSARIDRRSLVMRHNPVLREFDARSPLSVGNGEFAFTADVTGLQTFPQLYDNAMPLCTMAQWGWHTNPGRPAGGLRLTEFDTYGRKVGYPTGSSGQEELFNWLRENPHRLHLGRIGFEIERPEDVGGVEQSLDLWTGVLRSQFTWKGERIIVETCCHPQRDLLAVSVEGRIPVVVEFPYASPGMNAADWKHPAKHASLVRNGGKQIDIMRTLDRDAYSVSLASEGAAQWKPEDAHRFALRPSGERIGFVCEFSPRPPASAMPAVAETKAACERHWHSFWAGAAMEAPGAREIERRVVLSQYQTAIQCAGSLPPQETGLTCNSWFGKFHLEMHFWHAAHFAAWGRPELLERSLFYYGRILASARERAHDQGYSGARWPKMTDPVGRESPSPIGPLLVWQQPHPIVYAEIMYRARPRRETLERYREVVFATADFLASFAHYDERGKRYVLGPPVIPVQENHPPRETWNPTFELQYFADALEIAGRWRERLGMTPEPRWEDVRTHLSALPVKDGVYLAHENCPQTFTERNRDHPSMLGALGVLSGSKVDRETTRRTLRKVMAEWRWPDVWGWDFGMLAMTAASLGDREMAGDILTMETPKNAWLPNGHNWQRANLPLYLPGNGALLLAVAHMSRLKAFPVSWRAASEGLAASPLY
ncbi:MAG TPA: hypothetical protein VKB88_17440 [Bryobacteraceae bacterium]|nr:hypothetical protein [Bryobacteraceae bacterium]